MNLTIYGELIDQCAVDPQAASAFLAHIASGPIGVTMHDLQAPLVALCMQLIGSSDDDYHDQQKPAKKAPSRTSWAESLQNLFSIGTGWCGWTPAETWQSTPAEILAAYAGLNEKLRAIHGSAEQQKDEGTLADKAIGIFAGRGKVEFV